MNEKIITACPGDKIIINVVASESLTNYSFKQAAETLKISRTTIYRAIKDGKLETITIGKSKKITHESLTNYKK